MGKKEKKKKSESYLDGLIGWDKNFSSIETCFMDDPAIDQDASDIKAFYEDNFNTDHLRFHPGKTPVRVVITLPNSAEWASIMPHIKDAAEEEGMSAISVACHKAFELCVRLPDIEELQPEHRGGFKRLPESFMLAMGRKKPVLVEIIGSWIIQKSTLNDEEKKV